jgi:hypothetical protein
MESTTLTTHHYSYPYLYLCLQNVGSRSLPYPYTAHEHMADPGPFEPGICRAELGVLYPKC